MNRLDPENLLESVVRITKERDQDSLEHSWVETMGGLLNAGRITLYRITDDGHSLLTVACSGGCSGTEEGEQSLLPLAQVAEIDPSLMQCIESGRTLVLPLESGSRLIYPVHVNGRTIGSLDVLCSRPAGDPLGARLIAGFLRIYQNYLSILEDRDRDTLTGLYNRKTFDERISAILEHARLRIDNPPQGRERRGGGDDECHWLGILDIDHFKSINDTFGHLYGDEVLLIFSQIMRKTFRSGDLLFRYGGEEFVVVLAPSDLQQALTAFNRFRKAVEEHDFPKVGKVTVSAGVVRIHQQEVPATVVGHADQALYYAKQHGRNQVRSYEELMAIGELHEAEAAEDEVELF